VKKNHNGQQKKEGEVDVLDCMVVTFAVFHFEISALNLEALQIAVGVYVRENRKIVKKRREKKLG